MNEFGEALLGYLDARDMAVPALAEELTLKMGEPVTEWLLASMMTAALFERPHVRPSLFVFLGDVLGLTETEVVEELMWHYYLSTEGAFP